MTTIAQLYAHHSNTPSDINEHLPTLFAYAQKCERILELGVRGCVSSWAFAKGLLENGMDQKYLFCNDLTPCNISTLVEQCEHNAITVEHKWCSDLKLELEKDSFDLVFIDTFHVYGQLKRELQKFGDISKKYIIMHDTDVDGVRGEALRCGFNIQHMCNITGFPREEIVTGLQPAIDEFLTENPNKWSVDQVFTNNNGLTILKRV